MYAKLTNGSVSKYPVNFGDIKRDHPYTSFSENSDALETMGYVKVQHTNAPPYDPLFFKCIEKLPIYKDNNWVKNWEIVSLSVEEVVNGVSNLVQQRLDAFASTRNYSSILSAATYATSKVPKFQKEGQYCVDKRDETWATLYSILDQVQAGTIPQPSSWEEVEAMLPVLEWPE